MTRSVYTLEATQSLPLAEAMMERLQIRHVPVVDAKGHLVGIVSHRDLLAAKISALAPLTDDERSTLQLAVPVGRIMHASVRTIESDALAVQAARIMREHHFGCLPVVDGGTLVGIVTEADLLALVTDSLAIERPVHSWNLERVMTHVPVTITANTSLAEARALMTRYRIRHLPVVENGKPVSMVCERDLTVAETVFIETKLTPAAHVVRILGNVAIRCVALDAPLDHVLDEMTRDRLDAVLVMRDTRIVGIFTSTDACRVLAKLVRPSEAR